MKTFGLTVFALTAFAFNSILCRMALGANEADAPGFTAVRLVSGAIMLIALSYSFGRKKGSPVSGDWPSAIYLFVYAICFSLAYLGLAAGTGALILFGAVQFTMIAVSIMRGERPRPLEWAGLVIAIGGLVYLVFPGLTSPPLTSSLLMAFAGAAWGFYTLRGKRAGDPLADTTGNFVRAAPFAIIVAAVYWPTIHLSNRGLILAVLSGAVASGIGYAVWYAALKHLSSTRAAVMQLAVPVIAAGLGIALLNEAASLRLGVASAMILGGIGVTIIGKRS